MIKALDREYIGTGLKETNMFTQVDRFYLNCVYIRSLTISRGVPGESSAPGGDP